MISKIYSQVAYLKKVINQTGVTKKKMKELVVRAVYVEMLGQDASFAYIRAVELCASTNIIQKRVGYLAGKRGKSVMNQMNTTHVILSSNNQRRVVFPLNTSFDLCLSIKSKEI